MKEGSKECEGRKEVIVRMEGDGRKEYEERKMNEGRNEGSKEHKGMK